MLRRTFCHNVNRALGRVKLFCDTIPRKRTNTREWRHVRFVPKASQRTAQKVLLFDHLVSGDAQLSGTVRPSILAVWLPDRTSRCRKATAAIPFAAFCGC